MVQNLSKIYEGMINENVDYLVDLENELYGEVKLDELVRGALVFSSKNLTRKWLSGEKYVRTKFALEAIENYPVGVLNLSLLLDANINLMDDLLDETLPKNDRGLYIVELVRVLALRDKYDIDEGLRLRISNYFNKIILVAVSEQIFLEEMKQKKGDSFCECAYDYFGARSLDMDLFLEIPLHSMGCSPEEVDSVVKAGRLFRTLNLMKKDINDLKHDMDSDIETPLTLLVSRGESLKDFTSYICDRVLSEFPDSAEPVISNLKKLTKREKDEINKLTSAPFSKDAAKGEAEVIPIA